MIKYEKKLREGVPMNALENIFDVIYKKKLTGIYNESKVIEKKKKIVSNF